MAFQDTDLLLVGRGGGSFRSTAQELKTYVESGPVLTFRGSVDFTAAPDLSTPPSVGDMYINNTAGTVNAGWSGAAGSDTEVMDRMFWDGAQWDLITTAGQDFGVLDIDVTAPITKGGTDAEPTIGIDNASNSQRGSVRLAKNAYNPNGTINTTNNNDVLVGTHFDVLAGRITTAAGGGVQSVIGDNGLTASGTTTVTVAGIDAAVGTVGVTALSNTVADVATMAATPKAINDYAVPLDLSTLTELA